jgi:hypothetical protein
VELLSAAKLMTEAGKMLEAQYHLCRVIQLRFPGALTPDVETIITKQDDCRVLHKWFDVAVTAPTAEEVVAFIRKPRRWIEEMGTPPW